MMIKTLNPCGVARFVRAMLLIACVPAMSLACLFCVVLVRGSLPHPDAARNRSVVPAGNTNMGHGAVHADASVAMVPRIS